MKQRKRIIEILLEKGVNPGFRGFKYLVDAVALVAENETLIDIGITKALYPEIARVHKVSRANVEQAIRYAIANSNYTCTNRTFIMTIVWLLRIEEM